MNLGLYAYGIVTAGSLDAAPETSGVDPSHAPELFESRNLGAIVSRVDITEFEGEALQRNAAQPEWLERRVRAHERVLDVVLARTTVVPMRFGAIFSSADGLSALLTEHARTFTDALARVRGCSEWGVKVHCDVRRLVDGLADAAPEPVSGRGYLLRKKAVLDAEARTSDAVARIVREVHSSLGGIAEEAVTPASRAGAVLKGAYLVRDASREAFIRRVDEFQRRHVDAFTFEVTGPWPPYNFTSADVSGPLVAAR